MRKVLDIGGNDGSLALKFKQKDWEAFIIDPSGNLQSERFIKGIPSYTGMFSLKLAQSLKMKFDLITALNVLPHTPNPFDFLLGVKECLAPNGRLLLEFVYFKSTFELRDFGQIYFEHYSYFTLTSLLRLTRRAGFRFISSKFFPDIHGGTLRVVLEDVNSPCCQASFPLDSLNAEYLSGIQDLDVVRDWGKLVEDNIVKLSDTVKKFKAQGRTVVAYGASAKSSTLFNHKRFQSAASKISFVVDNNPLKVGRYCPGSNLPIKPAEELVALDNPVIIITAHNFKSEIIQKIKALTPKATIINYVPMVTVEEI